MQFPEVQKIVFLFRKIGVPISECRLCFKSLCFGFGMSFQFQNAVSVSEFRWPPLCATITIRLCSRVKTDLCGGRTMRPLRFCTDDDCE